MNSRILVAVNYVDYSEIARKEAQKDALEILATVAPENVQLASFNYLRSDVKVPERFEIIRKLKRNSRGTIHNNRDLPYIKDIFNLCAEMDCDIFGYLNSDILVARDFFETFKTFKENKKIFLFQRLEIKPVKKSEYLNGRFDVRDDSHPGYDGVFFEKQWWLKNEQRFNDDLVLGEPEWDWYYAKQIGDKNQTLVKRCLYHVFHKTIWTITSNGAKNNRRINGSIV